MPLPGPSISTHCIPALGGDGKASTREQGLGLKGGFFLCCHIFHCCEKPQIFPGFSVCPLHLIPGLGVLVPRMCDGRCAGGTLAPGEMCPCCCSHLPLPCDTCTSDTGPSHLGPSCVPCFSLWFGAALGHCAHREPLGRNELLHWLCYGFFPHPSSCLGSLLCFWSQLFIKWRAELEKCLNPSLVWGICMNMCLYF